MQRQPEVARVVAAMETGEVDGVVDGERQVIRRAGARWDDIRALDLGFRWNEAVDHHAVEHYRHRRRGLGFERERHRQSEPRAMAERRELHVALVPHPAPVIAALPFFVAIPAVAELDPAGDWNHRRFEITPIE